MKAHRHLFALLLLSSALTGCKTTENPNTKTDESAGEEIFMPKMQQNTYLSHNKQPQYFGFEAFTLQDGMYFRGRARLHPNHIATVSFEKGEVPVVEMRGRSPRMKVNMLLDTSSPDSWLEFLSFQELDGVFLGDGDVNIPYRGGYNTGNVNGYAAVVRHMRIDQLMMETNPFYVRMAMNSLGPLARGIEKPHVDGVYGWDHLRNFEYIQFDFDKRAVGFSATIPYIPHDDLVMTEARIIDLNNYGLAIDGSIYGEPTPIILDIGGDYHFARGDVKVSVTKQVSLGDVVYRKVPTLVLPINNSPPRAGRKMLQDYIITICPKKGVVYFERFPK